MNRLFELIHRFQRDERAQDLIEYALLAGFVAVAAGALLPGLSNHLSIIFSKMTSLTSNAAAQ